MKLTAFAVVHSRIDGVEHTVDAPLIHCFDGKKIVLAYVSRTALEDYFSLSARPSMQDSNLLVDRNLDALSRIVTSKYERGERSVYNTFGQSYPRVDVTLEDMKSSGEEFTAEVLKVKAMSEAMTRRFRDELHTPSQQS
jgi:hypothetical protein